MRKPRIFCPDLSAPIYKCSNIKQIHHLAKVLRLQPGDLVECFNGKGSIAHGKILELTKAFISFHVDDVLNASNPYKKYYQAIIPYIKKEIKMKMKKILTSRGLTGFFSDDKKAILNDISIDKNDN